MSVKTPTAGDDSPGQTQAPAAGGPGTPVSLIGGAVATDLCAHCGAPLAPDQRYCVECGTRRGTPRFILHQPAASASAPASAVPRASLRTAASWSRSAILGVVVAVLLAVGIGVLIGHYATSGTTVRVAVAAGTSSTGASSSSGGSGSTSGSGSGSTSGSGSGKSGTSTSSSSTVKPGGSCTKGTPGCVNGKETGDFFGS